MKLTEQEKNTILELKDKGLSNREIARRVLGRTSRKSTISDFLKVYCVETPYNIKSPKILVFDCEVAPILSYVWGRWKQNIYQDQILQESYVLTYGCKWLGQEEIIFGNLSAGEALAEDDKRLVKEVHDLFDMADIIIGHNIIQYDTKVLNTRFLLYGLKPPKPYKCIDTLRIARNKFRLSSNKLNDICEFLGLESKFENGGFKTWRGYMRGEEESIRTMIDYQIRDVNITENVYLKIRAWDDYHPNLQLLISSGNDKDPVISCPCCGSTEYCEQGFYYTNLRQYKSYQCQGCGKHFRGRKNQINTGDSKNLVIGI